MLTNSGTPNSWQPGMCVESVMNTVIQNMCAAPPSCSRLDRILQMNCKTPVMSGLHVQQGSGRSLACSTYIRLLSFSHLPAQDSFLTAMSHLLHLCLSTCCPLNNPTTANLYGRRLHVESVLVRTATGPGGISGPLRIDLEGRYSYKVMAVRFLPLLVLLRRSTHEWHTMFGSGAGGGV